MFVGGLLVRMALDSQIKQYRSMIHSPGKSGRVQAAGGYLEYFRWDFPGWGKLI